MHTSISDKPFSMIEWFSIQGEYGKHGSEPTFYLVLGGSVHAQVNSELFYMSAGDLLLAGSHDEVLLSGKGSNMVLTIALQGNFFARGRSEAFGRFICNSTCDRNRDYGFLRRLLARIALNAGEHDDFGHIRATELASSLLYYLNRYHYVPDAPTAEKKTLRDRQVRILNYLEMNYRNPISLQDLADLTHLAPTYLSRIFKKQIGSSFSDCLKKIRLEHAALDLTHSSAPISTIAFDNGFASIALFNRFFFERYSCSPGEYRKVNHMPVPPPQSPPQKSVPENLRSLAEGGDSGIDGLSYPMREEWNLIDVQYGKPAELLTMINVGYVFKSGNLNLQPQLEMAQSEIRFSYGRLQGLLFQDAIPTDENGEYNFYLFDRYLEMLLNCGMTPFLDLSLREYCQFRADLVPVFSDFNVTESSEMEARFFRRIEALLRHSINTFGSEEVEKWIFEIGYVHDRELHVGESPAGFVRRFISACRLIKSFLPNAKVGGISHNVCIGTELFEEIIDIMDYRHFSPDFISASIFPYECSEDGFRLTSDRQFVKNRAAELKVIMAAHPTITQSLWITDLGTGLRDRTFVNDSCFQAAYFIKATVDLIGVADLVGYWQLSDLASEYSDTPRLLFGGTGIVSRHGLKKPGYIALECIRGIHWQIVEKGDGMLVSTNSLNEWHVVLCNYTHFGDLLHIGKELTPEEAYSTFGAPATRDVYVSLNHLPAGRYRITEAIVNRENGSLLDAWLRYGILDDLQPKDIHYFRDTVHPNRHASLYDCSDGRLELHTQLLAHEVKIYKITRKL